MYIINCETFITLGQWEKDQLIFVVSIVPFYIHGEIGNHSTTVHCPMNLWKPLEEAWLMKAAPDRLWSVKIPGGQQFPRCFQHNVLHQRSCRSQSHDLIRSGLVKQLLNHFSDHFLKLYVLICSPMIHSSVIRHRGYPRK